MKKPTSFEEAYKMLDQAASDQNEPSLGSLISGELFNLKSAVSTELNDSKEELLRGSGELTSLARELGTLGVGHVEELAGVIDREVRKQPLLFIGGAAAAALLIGFIASRPRRVTATSVETEIVPGVYS